MQACLALFSLFIYFATASPQTYFQATNGGNIKSIPAVDALITRLEDETWKPDDEPCRQATLRMLWGVKNSTLWATWVWDAMQVPVGSMYGVQFHIGNYDQCLQAPWSSKEHGENPGLRTQYCIVDVKSEVVEETRKLGAFDNVEEYFRTPTQDSRRFNKQSFSTCLPAVCSTSSVANISRHLLQLTHLPDGELYVDPRDCQKSGEEVVYPTEFYAFWTVVGLLFTTAIVSTLRSNDETKQKSLDLVTKSFCLKRNYNGLFTVSRDEIKVINGMRFITAVFVVFAHEGFYAVLCPVVNGLELDKTVNSSVGRVISHMEVVVDTFFAVSGLLLIRGLMMGKRNNVLYTLIKRYMRLIGPLALSTLYLATTAKYVDRGPFWPRANRDEGDVCAANWWRNLLMVNTDIKTLCHVVTWYISCDFQLTIFATFLFYLFRKNKKLSVIAFVVVGVAVTLNLGYTVYSNHYDIIPFELKSIMLLRDNISLNYTYMRSHVRAGAYMVGMVMGYIMTTYKPAEYRNAINKKWSVILTVASLATLIIVFCIAIFFIDRPYDPLEAAVVVATNRMFWAVAICCIIGVCEYGSISRISDFLSWRGFVPLSKLSYCLYLVHPFILQKQKFSAKNVVTYGVFSLNLNACGVLVVSCAASFVFHLILEAPLINISNALFTQKSEPLQQNGIKKDSINTDNCLQNGNSKAKTS